MIRVTEFANPRMAQAFVDYMATKGIQLHIEQHENYQLLANDEQHLPEIEKELTQFLRNPADPRYLAASWQSGHTQHGIRYANGGVWNNVRQRTGPLTWTLMVLCILTFVVMQIKSEQWVLYWLSWPASSDQYFQVWRWFSHALMHFSILHIVFNLMWWWYLGGAIEKKLGSGKLFVITLISALLSGWMQAKFSGIEFGGLSGVVYALMGYSWLRGESDPASGIYLERGMIVFALIWLVAGYYGLFGMALANMAHFVGLVVGLAMAFTDSRAALKNR